MRRKTFGLEASPRATCSACEPVEALALEDESKLCGLALRELRDLLALTRDLRRVELLFGLAREVGTAAHGDGTGHCFGQPGDDDQRARRIRRRHARDDTERDEQPVLRTEHEFADTRETRDPLGLAQRVLGDVPLGLRAQLVGRLRPLGAHVDTVRALGARCPRDRPGSAGHGERLLRESAFELSPA